MQPVILDPRIFGNIEVRIGCFGGKGAAVRLGHGMGEMAAIDSLAVDRKRDRHFQQRFPLRLDLAHQQAFFPAVGPAVNRGAQTVVAVYRFDRGKGRQDFGQIEPVIFPFADARIEEFDRVGHGVIGGVDQCQLVIAAGQTALEGNRGGNRLLADDFAIRSEQPQPRLKTGSELIFEHIEIDFGL
ncbi:hypothetical protein SDC9_169707 [bioreactor metagenome]|uniref:Uncharacterized protein n=1 Tax=bioreactor metagenome TaxID=1076179 RepID=A0A645GE90_9ZZZZ